MSDPAPVNLAAAQPVDQPRLVPWASDPAPADFFEDEEIRGLTARASTYLRAGVPVHFRGPAGMGKTTLALHVAAGLGRPVIFLTGDAWMTRADLVGREVGQSFSKLDDQYIASVRRTETRSRIDWKDAVLANAMAEGATLVYDEFTRSPPEANATLLSVLEERVLVSTHPAAARPYIVAHPEFRVILTSNPEGYLGVSKAPDALMDRVVTFRVETVAEATEAGIVAAASGLALSEAARIVALVRRLRAGPSGEALGLSMRSAILIARLAQAVGASAEPGDPAFLQICADVLQDRVPPAALGAALRGLARGVAA